MSTPDIYQTLLDSLEGKETALGDRIALNGHAGRYFGFDLFVSNAIGWSSTLEGGTTAPSDGDTVTVNGVVFTFKTTLGTTAGNVLIGATLATALTAIEDAINDDESLSAQNGGAGASTVGTNYVELTAANRDKLYDITATASGNTMTMKAQGYGYIAVSETLTPAALTFTAAKQVQHALMGVANSVDAVIQVTPNLEIKDRDGKVGKDVVTWTAWGVKTFNEHILKMIDVRVRTAAY